jgi:HK97 family phage major capsid protein
MRVNLLAEKRELQRQIDALLAKPSGMSASERKQCDALLSKVADIRAQEQRYARLDDATAETNRASEAERQRTIKIEGAFQHYLRTADSTELRTYTPMTTADTPIPELFYAAYGERLKSFSGIREVANVITTKNGDNLKNPFTDDSANVGERLAENSAVSLVNPTFSDVVFGAFRYSSKGVQYSARLLQDSGINLTEYLAEIFAKRIGRITNTEFTNGGSGGPTGVIPSLTQIQTSASATAVTVAEIVGLQNVDEGYLDGAVYMFSPGVERTLKAEVNADGLPVFPEMRNGRVLAGYPYVLNVDMPSSLTASAKTIIFGNFKLGVTVRDVTPSILVSKERFAESNLLYASMRHDQDCKVVDVDALNVLQQHS